MKILGIILGLAFGAGIGCVVGFMGRREIMWMMGTIPYSSESIGYFWFFLINPIFMIIGLLAGGLTVYALIPSKNVVLPD